MPATKRSKKTGPALVEARKRDKRYVHRKGGSRTEESAGRALAIDRAHKTKNEAPKGQRQCDD